MKRKMWLVTVALLLASLVLPLAGVAAEDSGRNHPIVRFEGVVTSRPSDTKIGEWVISGQSVMVVASTRFIEIKGPAVVNAKVVVIARRVNSGQLEAMLIHVIEPAVAVVKIQGFVTELGQDYLVVNGLRIMITAETDIAGELAVGALVKIEAEVTAFSYVAKRIEVLPVVRPRFVEFEGAIEAMDDTEWTVDGRRITVNERTVIIGTPDVGDWVEVRALVQSDNTLLALMIKVREEPEQEDWMGRIERLPRWGTIGQWVIGGRPVMVTWATEIVGTPQVGKTATVQAMRYRRQPPVAIRIEIVEPTPTATPTATPTETETPESTEALAPMTAP